MAKLAAHGYEVARVKFLAAPGLIGPDTEYEVVLSFRSDGHIMRKLKALNIHPIRPGERASLAHADYGWKLYKKLGDRTRDTVGRQKNLAVRTVNALDAGDGYTILDSTI